ncbi:MAG: adenylate/guanylate cyclase domain-containing protein [Candidatus Riflebacteria bacterium]|nr:adenylate/guanylate cyclase domain-containing protein [Candidatus Riflebacteria bacterium]
MNSQKKFSALAILAAWLFLAIPFVLVLIDWSSSRQRDFAKLVDTSNQNSRTLIEKMQVSGNWEYQILQRLNTFQRSLRAKIESAGSNSITAAAEKLYQQQLKNGLPPHHLSVAVKTEKDELPTTVFESSTLPGPNLLSSLTPLMREETCSKFQYDDAAEKLSIMTGFPVNVLTISFSQNAIKRKDEGIMIPFTSKSGNTLLYWFYPDTAGKRVLVSAIFDVKSIASDYSYKALIDTADSATTGFAFLPMSGNGKPFWSPLLRKQPRLQRFIKNEVTRLPMTLVQKEFGEFNICAAPVLVGEPAFIILVSRQIAAIPLSIGETCFIALVFVLFGGLSLMLLQRKIFRRGWRISIALVMLTAIISIFYLPAGLGRLVVKYSMDSHLSVMRKKAESDLERNLQCLEDRYDLSMADFFYRVQHLENYPEIMQLIANEKQSEALEAIDNKVKALYPTQLGNSLLFMSLQQDTGENTIRLRKQEDAKKISEMISPLLKSLLHKYRPELIKKTQQSSENLSLQGVKDEMITDFIVNFFQGILGQKLYHQLMANSSNLVEVDSTFIMISMTGLPLKFNGVIRALLLIMWSEFNESEDYLDFLINNRSQLADNFEFIAVRKGAFQGFNRSTTPVIPQAWDLTERTRRVGIQLTSRELLSTEDRLLIKSRPGKSLRMYILTGITSLKEVFAEQMRLEQEFNNRLLSGLILLLFMVIGLYWYFMSPLKQLQIGLNNVRLGDFHTRINADHRQDEFGHIARSFNTMAKGLEEGSLLGKFVSSAVINVIRDKAAFEKAMIGERREMTILFASIKTDANSEAEVFLDKLAFHLKSCQEAVRQTSGVIDKVMENKILVFFDHEACQSADEAVKQGIETVVSLKQQLMSQGCSGYYGLATGSVVAGILGAKDIRLDYTVIGDAVNLSARLNALAEKDSGSKIIIESTTRRHLANSIQAESLGEINIKGKTEPVPIYRV